MAIVNDNGNLDTLQNAPNDNLYFNRDGTLTGKAFYTTKQSGGSMSLFIGQAHPDDGNAFCAQYGYEWDEAGFINGTADFVGIWSATVQTVDCIATTNQQPIVRHPGFPPNSVITLGFGGTPSAPQNSAYFDPVSGDFIDFPSGAPSGLAGVQSFLEAGITIRITYSTMDVGTVEDSVNKIGEILSSLTAGSITYAYGYDAWQCTNVTYKEIPLGSAGSTFSVTEEYLFSQPGGWNDLIYPVNQYP